MQDQVKPSYESTWKLLKLWDQILLLVVVSDAVIIAVFATTDFGLEPLVASLILYGVVAVCLAGLAMLVGLRSMTRCPRCGNAFYLKGTSSNPLSGRCVHCGLPRDAQPPMSER
jgi:hypothetical protein